LIRHQDDNRAILGGSRARDGSERGVATWRAWLV